MPAEWARHRSTWLSWPKDPATFPPEIIGRVEQAYTTMVESLAKGEVVNILVDDETMERRVSSLLGGGRNVVFRRIKSADVWMRDYGPIFVGDGRGSLVATKWTFNAWGDKYDDLKPDNMAGLEVARAAGYKVLQTGIVLEGGSIDTNGLGTCLTTEQCLLNKNRNPSMDRAKIEGALEKHLGFDNVVWLKDGIVGDDTDGHIDDIARFVDERTAICMVEPDPSDANFRALQRNYELLTQAEDQEGRSIKVVGIEMPKKKVGGEERLPASYANFYVGNSAVLVPTFDDANDDAALSTIGKAFPGRKAVGINCEALVYGFGGIHCVTQQEPEPESAPERLA